MKKLIFILPFIGVMLLSSCVSQRKVINVEALIVSDFLDFKQFRNQGVSISPYDCATKKYTPIGKISILQQPEIVTKRKEANSPKKANELHAQAKPGYVYMVSELDLYAAVQEMVNIVKAQGGNAVFDFEYRYIPESLDTGPGYSPLKYNQLLVTGFAVYLEE